MTWPEVSWPDTPVHQMVRRAEAGTELRFCIPDLRHLRITESLRLERPLRSSSPTVNPTPPCLLNHVPKCHIYTFFEHHKGWGLHHFPGQPIPMPDHSFISVKNFFLISNLNLPWCNMRPLPFILLLVTWEKRSTPTSL